MPDAINADPSDPGKPGNQTSEFSLTKLVAWLGGILAILIPVLAVLGDSFGKLSGTFPEAHWLGACGAAAAAILSVAIAVSKYTGNRSDIKAAQIAGAAQVQAAKAAAGPR